MAIPSTATLMHHTGDVHQDIAMGIHAKDFPFLADILNGLYSKVIAAFVREYSTNAWDSHVAAGVLRPIEITLPTLDSLEFIVQDYGLGMSLDDLTNTYAFYGASDKRDSNEVAGQLGLGSKSGLAYATAFVVTAVKDHEKVVAMVTKDERGLGVIRILIPPAASDEPNSVRITIPIDRYDVDEVREEAENFFQFWSPGTVLIDGAPPATPEWATSALRIDDDTWLVRDDAGLYTSYVIMGNVAYPVDDAFANGHSRRFVARLNIGDVDFVPSREDVKYTDWSKETLRDLSAFVKTHYRRVLDSAIARATSPWEEAQIKMLWKGSKATDLRSDSHDRRIWTFNPSVRWGRKSQAHAKYGLSNLIESKTVVITGFAAKNVSAAAKERLTERFGSDAFFVILPSGTRGTHLLEGRPNVHTWESVVGATTKPKAPRGSRGPKVETIYSTNGGGMTADNLASLSHKVLFLYPGEHASKGSLDATVVSLYSSAQEARLRRLVPGIEHYDVELERQRASALKAITPQDRRIVQARTLPSHFAPLDHTKVDDPELAEHLRLSKMDDTDTLAKAKALGVGIGPSADLPDYSARYPLVYSGGGYYAHRNVDLDDERLFYVNAKYAATKVKAFTQALTHGAVAS